MLNILSIVLAGAAMLMPHYEEQPAQRLTIGARVFYPGGKPASAISQRFTLGSTPAVWYVFTGTTLCEAQTVSSEKPASAGNGWRIELKPNANGSNTFQATWERLWAGGKPATGGGTRPLTLGAASPTVLDSIDGGARLQRQEDLGRLKATHTLTDLSSSRLGEFADGRIANFRAELADLEQTRRQLIEVHRLGAQNPQVMAVDSKIAGKRREMQEYWTTALPKFIEMLGNAPIAAVDGCDALSMSLEISAETTAARVPTETEFWLVHRDPSGKEDTQRQVVRSIGYGVDFVFDDIPIQTDRGLVTVETYGWVSLTANAGSTDAYMNLTITRRSVTTAPAFGWKTKEGGTSFSQSIRPEEVVAFQLAPMKDDDGALLGHRFSVRVRTRILK